jgi:selenocysteine lyase/cysteine desulfurase
VENPFDLERMLAFELTFPTSAKRFEPSFQPLVQVFGLGATLDLLNEAGAAAIEARVMALSQRLVAGLLEKGYQVAGSPDGRARSAIVSVILHDEAERARVERGLRKAEARCSVRESRVRLSPHFYNTEEEIDRMLSSL